MKIITTIVLIISLFTLILTSQIPREKMDTTPPETVLENSCRVDIDNGTFILYYQLNDGTPQNKGGMLILKENGDDFGSIHYTVDMKISLNGLGYKTKTLATTGKDGFSLFQYTMTSASSVDTTKCY